MTALALIENLARDVLSRASAADTMVASAESCTGGMVAAALTDIAGSSAVVDRAYVTYSNAAKTAMLAVPAEVIAEHGAVSEPVVRAMANAAANAIDHSGGKLAISISGVAGPGGGSVEKPVGLVWFGLAHTRGNRQDVAAEHHVFEGDRAAVRAAATAHALRMLLSRL